jgi:hypothetical protein
VTLRASFLDVVQPCAQVSRRKDDEPGDKTCQRQEWGPRRLDREANTYRTGGAAVSMAAVSERLTEAANIMQIQLR